MLKTYLRRQRETERDRKGGRKAEERERGGVNRCGFMCTSVVYPNAWGVARLIKLFWRMEELFYYSTTTIFIWDSNLQGPESLA